MFPNQQNEPGVQPPYPPIPQTGVNSMPQQASNGQYAVVPPLPTANNTGHSGHNPYEFIVNPNTNQAKRSLFGGPNALAMRLAVIVGGTVLLMVIIAIVVSALAPKGSTPGLTAIAQRQQEIIRVATLASSEASGQDARNFATNVQLSVTSSQQQVLSYLASHGTKLKTKTLALDQSTQTNNLLTSAQSAGTFDSAATQELSSELTTYEGLLQTTYKQASSKTAKQVLQTGYDSAVKLVAQAKTLVITN